jgi:hypothetical protein
MLFIVATVGEVDGVDFTLAERHGHDFVLKKVLGWCNSQRSDLKVATLACNVRLN